MVRDRALGEHQEDRRREKILQTGQSAWAIFFSFRVRLPNMGLCYHSGFVGLSGTHCTMERPIEHCCKHQGRVHREGQGGERADAAEGEGSQRKVGDRGET